MERAAVPSMIREEKLRHWIEAYSGALMKTCYVYLTDRALAEDAVQDTFLKAWKHMDELDKRGIENEKAWLLRIAIHVCIDYRRSAWFRHTDRHQDGGELALRIPAETQEHTLTLDLCRLPDKYKQVVLLYYYQGLTLEEAASVLGITKSSVHRRLQKAQALLKEHWLGGEDRA